MHGQPFLIPLTKLKYLSHKKVSIIKIYGLASSKYCHLWSASVAASYWGLHCTLMSSVHLCKVYTYVQWGAIIMWSNIKWYCICHCIHLAVSIHKRHLIAHPNRRAVGCLLWGFFRKLTVLWWHRTVSWFMRAVCFSHIQYSTSILAPQHRSTFGEWPWVLRDACCLMLPSQCWSSLGHLPENSFISRIQHGWII